MVLLSIPEKILLFICGAGILQGILLAILVYFHRKADKTVNTFLALYICSTSMVMTLPLMMKFLGWQNSFFVMPLPLLPGPLLFLYLLSFRQRITWQKALPHFILFVLFFFIVRWNLSVLQQQYPNAEELPASALQRPATLILSCVRSLQQLFYFFLARKALRSYQQGIRHLFSETSRINLSWASFLVNGYLILILTFIAIFPLILRYPEQFNLLLLLNMAVATPYIYIATFKGILQPTIWQLQHETDKETIEGQLHEVENIQVPEPGIPSGRNEEVIERITWLMTEERLFQEPELTLQQLAAKLSMPAYQVSQVLNEDMKKTFYDLVNGYRVEEAKRLLLDPKGNNFTILSIGFEAGFNSKTTFNTVFKKFTGQTPTVFREMNQVRP